MANLYVRSSDGSDADNGTTWALAKATLTGAAAIDSTTDRTIMVSDNHAESTAGALTFAWAGTQASPTIIRCVDDSAEPPTATASTATVTTTTNTSGISLTSSAAIAYFEGISFTSGSGATSNNALNCNSGTGGQVMLAHCSLIMAATGSTSFINLSGGGTNCLSVLEDVDFRFAAAGQSLQNSSRANLVRWNGGALLSGGTSPTNLFTTQGDGSNMLISGLDLTNAGAGINLFNSTQGGVTVVCRDWKLPDSWSGAFHSGTPGRGSRFSFYNCDSADTNYRMHIATAFGTVVNEAVIVRTGGANDGTNGIAWKMVSGADAEWPLLFLDSDEIVRWNETTGSAITVTMEMITDNVTLQDDDIEMVVTYLGTSGRPLASFSTSGNANTLDAGANLTTSSETWTTTGLTTPVKQKMSVSLTPQEKGYIHAAVRLYRASSTVYLDPELTVT